MKQDWGGFPSVGNVRTQQVVATPQVNWTGSTLRAALAAIVTHFRRHVPSLNALNVFPVPDGDTGTNMLLTLESALQATDGERSATAGTVLEQAARGALLGARGNSGVILFQLFRGLAQVAHNARVLDAAQLGAGLAEGARLAYQAVLHPVEGTMLTVLREVAEAAQQALAQGCTLAELLAVCRDTAIASVRKTPDLLPILRQAGVVDAGGQGIAVMFDAAAAFAANTSPILQPPGDVQEGHIAQTMTFLDNIEALHGDDAFGYCVNFVLLGENLPLETLRETLNELGTSAVLVGDQQAVKVHVHTEHPGQLLEAALAFGELDAVRIDNMSLQTRALRAAREKASESPHHAQSSRTGLVAVVPSPELAKVFASFGAATVRGGPGMVPSAEEIAHAIAALPQDTVLVLPNDPNVATTARHAAQFIADKQVDVLPISRIPQGLVAATAFHPDAETHEVARQIIEASQHVRAIAVTKATRDLDEPVTVRAGEWLALVDDTIVVSTPDFVTTALAAFEAANAAEAELATLILGRDAPPIDSLIQSIQERWPGLALETIEGGQPLYPLMVALE